MKKVKFAGSVVLALTGAAFALQACGKQLSRVSTVQGLSGGVPATSIPAGKSVSTVNPAMVGSYSYSSSDCRAADGSQTPVLLRGTQPIGSITFSDKQVSTQISYSTGCQVTSTYALLGIDNQSFVVGTPSVSVTMNGMPDTYGDCASVTPANASSSAVSFNYVLSNGQLGILTSPTDPCQAGEQDEDVYYRL